MLKNRHDDDLDIDAIDQIWALIGQIGHGILERAATDDEISERRLFMNRLRWTISEQIDLIEGDTLIDYKFTSAGLQIVAILRDWIARDLKKYNYPKCPVELVRLEHQVD